jgi:hypothetical protein
MESGGYATNGPAHRPMLIRDRSTQKAAAPAGG